MTGQRAIALNAGGFRRKAEAAMIESMDAVHMTEADLVRDIASVMDRVRSGEEITIERDARPLAMLRAAAPRRRKLSEIMAAPPDNSEAALDADFATDVQSFYR